MMKSYRLAIHVFLVFGYLFSLPAISFAYPTAQVAKAKPEGVWDAWVVSPGGKIFFGLEIQDGGEALSGFFLNGPEKIKIPTIAKQGGKWVIDVSHYDSKIVFEMKEGGLIGEWVKRKGVDKWTRMQFAAKQAAAKPKQSKIALKPFLGKWLTKFQSDSDEAVAVFKFNDSTDRAVGTFLTTTGDYRYLDSHLENGSLFLSCFDGAHAFLFRVKSIDSETIAGEFWSSDSWYDKFDGKRKTQVELADAFAQTKAADQSQLGKLSFPDLDGKPTRLNDPKFAGKARIIYVFGSWCPNCHDAASYFSELEKKYKGRGLSILGLAFEHTGDFARDSEQVRRYLKRHGSKYPVLLAGLSDKKMATEAFPVLDRVRSYPTTLFLDSEGNVKAIHTGFTGPATGDAFDKLKDKFEGLIDGLLENE